MTVDVLERWSVVGKQRGTQDPPPALTSKVNMSPLPIVCGVPPHLLGAGDQIS